MQTGLQKREYRGFSPFDNSATSRLMRMGLLGTNGAANVDAVSVVAKVYSGLFYDIIMSFASYLKIAPNTMQIMVRTQLADMSAYIARMKGYAEEEENEKCREMIEDNIAEISWLSGSGAISRRFFLVFEYEPHMKAKRNTVKYIAQRLNEEADVARRYLDVCGLEVLEPHYADNTLLELLYELINKHTGHRVKLPEGVFDMTTTVHGIYETENRL